MAVARREVFDIGAPGLEGRSKEMYGLLYYEYVSNQESEDVIISY